MKVLVVTNMYPRPAAPSHGVFVGDQVASLCRLGVEVDVLFMNGRANKLNYLKAYPRLWNTLRKKKYDVIHAHYIFSGLVARAQWQAPVVLTHHGPEVFMTYERHFCRAATPWFDRVIVVSQEMADRLGYKKSIVIPCGVDMRRFSPVSRDDARQRTGLPLDKKLVLWAGEFFRPEKRYEIVEEAMRRLTAEDPNVELVLLSGRPHADVPMYMNAADVLLLTSDAEGSPMVVKEAMSCNIPVVATDVGDVRDVIGKTDGCYITTQDPADVVANLKRALAFGRRTNGREAVAPMEIDAISRRIIAVYEDAIAERRGVSIQRHDFTETAR
ncbi:MAG: glycosyltransferase family 4 protein [Chloroflexota bacterium]